MPDKARDIVRVQPVPFAATYAWSVGELMEKFIKSLKDKKLIGSKCPGCGYTYAPPRNLCGKCGAKITDKDTVKLSGKAVLQSYTIGRVELDAAGVWKDLKKPAIIGAIKLEGADSTLFAPLEVAQKDLKPGLALQVVWAEKPKGEIADIKGFKKA